MDNKPVYGLASCLSNVFKLAEVEGLKWVRYVGPNSSSLETPRDDPVLISYAKLLNEGFACSWSRLSPSTDGVSGEGKDLWVFYFTTLPDLSEQLAPGLQEQSVGSWDSGTGMSSESSSMLFRALNGLIERSLLAENFLPLGKWFARSDTTMGSDGRYILIVTNNGMADYVSGCHIELWLDKGCFLCNFSFFIYAHLYICASVDVRAGPALSPLLSSHLQQALASSSGTQVILSPSGVNAIMTGHSYQITDPGIEELLEEWKLFYPVRFGVTTDLSSPLPAAVEVVLGGVRLRYPSQFVFVYHTEGSFPTPPASPIEEGITEQIIQNGWEDASCYDPFMLQKDCESCNCYHYNKESAGKPSRPHRLMSGDSSLKSEKTISKRYRPYPGHPTDNATPMREQSSLHLSSSVLNTQRRHLGPPKYATSLPSPAVVKGPPSFPAPSLPPVTTSTPPLPPLPPPAVQSKDYNVSQVIDLITASSAEKEQSSSLYNKRDSGWWQCMTLPDSVSSIQRLVTPVSPWVNTGGVHVPSSPNLLTLNNRKISSPVRRVKSNVGIDTESPRKRSVSGRGGNKVTRIRSHEVVGPPVVLPHTSFQEDTLEGNISVYDSSTGAINDDLSLGNNLKPVCPGNMDFTSANAVKISGDLGSFTSLFDDSEEEDEKMNCTDHEGDSKTATVGANRKASKLFCSDFHPPPDLSHIYPTPPSVETTDEKFDDKTVVMCIEEKNEVIEMSLISKLSPFDDVMMELIPDDFRSLTGIVSTQTLKHYVYTKTKTVPVNSNTTTVHDKPSSSVINKLEPQKFIFPPPSSLVNRTALSLPLSSRDTNSPLLSTPLPPTGSPLRGGRFPKHCSQQTPVAESPFDPITPTPLSHSSRLNPLLPEAHALYISLALLDSALAANVSDNVAIDFSAIQNFMLKRNSWRTQLDSVGSVSTPTVTTVNDGGDNGGIFKLEDEKPLMMVGIADYPSLGFKEDVIVTTPAPGWQNTSSHSHLIDDEGQSSSVFLSIVQDYCFHLCLTGKEEALCHSNNTLPSTPLQPYRQSSSKHSCRLYHTHSVSSAIMGGKHLVSKPKPSFTGGGGIKQLPTQPSLDKEDNSAAWILDLLTLPNKFVTKKLRELRGVFQSSFHHAPCIKVSTKGPLSLRDLNGLTPNQSHTDECIPLPMQPLVVGYDQEWINVSPLAVPTWDKLLFEPYSSQKHILYLVVSPGGESSLETVKTFFKNVSVAYKSLRLGVHVPLDKGGWECGIITKPDTKVKIEEDSDKVPSSLPTASLETICKDVLNPFLEQLTDDDTCYDNTSHEIPSNKPFSNATPHFIVIYVIIKGSEYRSLNGKGNKNEGIVQVMKAMSSVLSNDVLPEAVKYRIIVQPLEESELIGPQATSSHHLRSLVFSIFSRCSPSPDIYTDFHQLTNFGPISVRPKSCNPQVKLYSPLYILSSEPSQSSVLFTAEESTLFCSYCVTADKKWLIAVVCDRHGELLDTSVIGLPPNDIEGSMGSKFQALQKLWLYVISKVSSGVLKWNVIISRLGKPSSAEIKEWPRVICNDGLMTANQLLKNDCDYCSHSSSSPYIKNVVVVSVQPERNIQLFPTNDSSSSVSHVLVLPPRPNSLPAMTPTENNDMDLMNMVDDFDTAFPAIEGIHDDDLFQGLDDMDLDIHGTNFKEDVRAPLATGYLISTTPPGNLPNEFWGHDRPQSTCHMFKTLLHCHLSVHAFPGSPPDVLRSILLAFDALSWLSINHVTQQRNSSLPIHLFLLSKLYNFFTLMQR